MGVDSVETHLEPLRKKYGDRLLQAKSKQDVTAGELIGVVKTAYTTTIAGVVADEARLRIRRSLEEALVELCSVPRTAIAELTGGKAEVLLTLVASRLRDGLASDGADFLQEALSGEAGGVSTAALRRLQSIWHYFFPTDNYVRRGDVVRVDGRTLLVISAQCDLHQFAKKTALYLTMAPMIELTKANLDAVKAKCKVELTTIGPSPIASHDEFGHAFVILHNVPATRGSRDSLKDYFVRCHALESREMPPVATTPEMTAKAIKAAARTPLRYSEGVGIERVCTLAEAFGAAIVGHVVSALTASATPNFPPFEQKRLQGLIS